MELPVVPGTPAGPEYGLQATCRASCRFDCGALVSRLPKGNGDTFGQVLQRRVDRRGLLKAGLVVAVAAALSPAALAAPVARASSAARPVAQPAGLGFLAIQPDTADVVTVAASHSSQVLLRWGDALRPGLPPFDLATQSATLQEQRFGYNNDFVAYLPLPQGASTANEGLLWVNHEYTDGLMMFPGYDPKAPTRD